MESPEIVLNGELSSEPIGTWRRVLNKLSSVVIPLVLLKPHFFIIRFPSTLQATEDPGYKNVISVHLSNENKQNHQGVACPLPPPLPFTTKEIGLLGNVWPFYVFTCLWQICKYWTPYAPVRPQCIWHYIPPLPTHPNTLLAGHYLC